MSTPMPVLIVLRTFAMAVVAVGPIAWRWRRSPKAMFGFGAAAWFASVASKIAWAVPMNPLVHALLSPRLPSFAAAAVFDGYVGMLTGVFEVGLVFVLARCVQRFRGASVDDALAFGLGFGGAEAAVLAFGGLAALAHTEGFTTASIFVGPVERASATLVHVFCATLVLSPTFRVVPWRSFGLAFAFKSVIDAVAAFAALEMDVLQSPPRTVMFELGMATVATSALLLMNRATMLRAKTA